VFKEELIESTQFLQSSVRLLLQKSTQALRFKQLFGPGFEFEMFRGFKNNPFSTSCVQPEKKIIPRIKKRVFFFIK
jgi:hypothetical protein